MSEEMAQQWRSLRDEFVERMRALGVEFDADGNIIQEKRDE